MADDTNGRVKLVMGQIEQLIQGLLASHEGEHRAVHSVDAGPRSVLSSRESREESTPSAPPSDPHLVPEPAPAPCARRVEPPKTKPVQFQPESSIASQRSLLSSGVEEEEEEDDTTGFKLGLSWTKRHQELGKYRINSKGTKTISTTIAVVYDISHSRPSNWRRFWAAGVAAVLFWDCISIPLLALSFHEPWVMELLRIIFWTLHG